MDTRLCRELAGLLQEASRITVFTGAGVSTASGIPDFRGEKGLYSYVQAHYNLPYPEALFDLTYFSEDPEPFYSFSSQLMTEEIYPSHTHRFIAWLEKQGKLSLVMTQNIDMLHQKAGNTKVFEVHGTYQTAHCLSCNQKFDLVDFEANLREGRVKLCSCGGLVKPDIVFFGEQLPAGFFELYEKPPRTDLLLALGTSLTVQPAAAFPLRLISEDITSILINLQPTPYDRQFTHTVHQDLDTVIDQIWDSMTGS